MYMVGDVSDAVFVAAVVLHLPSNLALLVVAQNPEQTLAVKSKNVCTVKGL